ncbi:peptide chain release factor N(5)-glutamine methyltransferase [Cumulibacter soli]|uniref:peptide chain release factor N(5)-glutamine methyltransferase n=1 Tax=Cumulibacter soli TaxID=2546344 RepID=UPI001ABAD70F|nr:peptide chain release factor N(5)-glutamine methyltransferase [Cumulibacter soli]
MITAGPVHRVRSAGMTALRAAGIAAAEHDATELLAHVLGRPRGMLPLAPGVDAQQASRYADLIARRGAREPLQHLTGTAGFYGLELHVGPGGFIPRPETEMLVETALAATEVIAEPTVIDLCAGTGAIAIAIAVARPTAQVIALERSADAVGWLRRNVEQFAPKVQVVHDDVLRAELRTGAADLVTCNPPYVPASTGIDQEVRHDPSEAVFAGADGLDLIRPLVARIADLLRPGGVTVLEHDASHQNAVLELFAASGRYDAITPLRDLAGRPRFVRATLQR